MNLNERLVAVETKIEQIIIDRERNEQAQEKMLDTLNDLKDAIDSINSTISRYKGFVGGVFFVLSAIGVFLSKSGWWIWQMLSGRGHG